MGQIRKNQSKKPPQASRRRIAGGPGGAYGNKLGNEAPAGQAPEDCT